MPAWLAIACGGAGGALCRWWLSGAVQRWVGRDFPWGTLAVNVLGSFAMGLLAVLLVERLALGPAWRAGLLIGFLGAFTTFSTFAFETANLGFDQVGMKALGNIVASVVLCLAAVLAGMLLARQLGS